MKLEEKINEILKEWDPVGISTYSYSSKEEQLKYLNWLEDEYTNYIKPILNIIKTRNAKIEDLRDFIYRKELDISGIPLGSDMDIKTQLKSSGGYLDDELYKNRQNEVEKIIDKLWALRV